MNKLYNTQENLARFFQKVTKIKKPQLKIIPYIILGMIESESVVTTDIVKKLKGNFSLVNPFSTVRRLERFLIILNLIFINFITKLFLMLYLTILLKTKKFISVWIICIVEMILQY